MEPNKTDYKKYYMIGAVVYVIILLILLATLAGQVENPSLSFGAALGNAFSRINDYRFQAFYPITGKFGTVMIVTLVFWMALYLYILKEKQKYKMALGKESGSAKWNTNLKAFDKKRNYPYGKPEHSYEQNAIITQDVFLGLDGFKTQRNLNILVIGGSGAGKSRFFCKPNLLQADDKTSFVVTDPKGELLETTGQFLKDQGYKVVVFNLTDMAHTYRYNPFDYIRKEEDVLVLVNCLIKNTTPPDSHGGDPFWEKSETALLEAIFFYLWQHCEKEKRDFTHVMELLRECQVDEDKGDTVSEFDKKFIEIGNKNPQDLGYKSYQTFKMGAGKTLKSILISCAVRLNTFDIPAVANMIRTDLDNPELNINLMELGFEKTALFCVIPSADDTYNFIVSMMYSQLFETLYYYQEHGATWKGNEYSRLTHRVRFLLDEFCNIGQIPTFEKKLATMRSYGLSCAIIVQNKKQLEEMYDKKTEGLIGNCDTTLFLGSPEPETLKYISERLGNTTITARNTSQSKGRNGSYSESHNQTQRALMTPDEIGKMSEKNCIAFIRGYDPFFGPKYNYPDHPNYKYTADADDSKKYDLIALFKEIESNNLLKKEEETRKQLTAPEVEKEEVPPVVAITKNVIHDPMDSIANDLRIMMAKQEETFGSSTESNNINESGKKETVKTSNATIVQLSEKENSESDSSSRKELTPKSTEKTIKRDAKEDSTRDSLAMTFLEGDESSSNSDLFDGLDED